MSLETEINEKIEEINKAQLEGDIEKVLDKIDELHKFGLDCFIEINFPLAVRVFSFEDEILNEIITFTNNLDDPDFDEKERNDFLSYLNDNSLETNAFLQYCTGSINLQKGNNIDAIENFNEASNLFGKLYEKTEDNFLKLFKSYSDFFSLTSQANDYTFWRKYGDAIVNHDQAIGLLENLLESDFAKDLDIKTKETLFRSMKIELNNAIFTKNYFRFIDYFYKDEFEEASESAENGFNAMEELENELNQIEIPNTITNMLRANIKFSEAIKDISQGELCREKEKWEQAEEFYRSANNHLDESVHYLGRSTLTKSQKTQGIYSSISSFIQLCKLRLKREKRLKDKIHEIENENKVLKVFQNDLIHDLKAVSGISVNIENKNEAKSTLQQNINFITKMENNARDNLKKLLPELNKIQSTKDAEKINQIKNDTEDLINTEEHGQSFFEKFKVFANNLKKTTKEVGETAAPILPIVETILQVAAFLFV